MRDAEISVPIVVVLILASGEDAHCTRGILRLDLATIKRREAIDLKDMEQ
jgi:hypothetical protein